MKKSHGKAKVKTKPAKMEYSGHWIEGNIWFNIGVSKTEARMLKAIKDQILLKPGTQNSSAKTMRILLQTCMAHYDVLEPLMFQDVNYSDKEGFLLTDDYLKGLIAQQHARIAPCPKGASK